MKIEYQECQIEDVFNYFVKGFRPADIVKYEANYDPRTGKVIFRLYIAEKKDNTSEK